jgi:glucose-1-phosphate adenylyltransferase
MFMADWTEVTGQFRAPLQNPERRRSPEVMPLVESTYAVVLAGGRGSRLGELTAWRAKPAVPFGGMHRIIDFTLSNCIHSGIRRIGVATQYRPHSLIRHLQHGWAFLDAGRQEFLDILTANNPVEAGWFSGTANAVYQNLDVLRMEDPRFVLVLAGDHIYKMDYGVMLAEHCEHGAAVSVACIEVPIAQANAFGVMSVDEHSRVVEFDEKPQRPMPIPGDPDRALVSMGIYVFDADVLYRYLRADAGGAESSHDFGRDVIPAVIRNKEVVLAHRFAASCVNMVHGRPYWRDVGTVDAYWEANMDLTRVQPDLNMYDPAWPIRSHHDYLPPAKLIFDSPVERGQTADALISSGCIVSGAAVHRSLLFTDVQVERGSFIEDSVVLPGVRVGRNVRLRRAIVDKHCRLPDGFQVGFDPVVDAARFGVTPNGIALITPEMLGMAVHHTVE